MIRANKEIEYEYLPNTSILTKETFTYEDLKRVNEYQYEDERLKGVKIW